MDTKMILDKLYSEGKISKQAYKTYVGQIKHGDETACVIGLRRKHLIDDKGEMKDGKVITTRTS